MPKLTLPDPNAEKPTSNVLSDDVVAELRDLPSVEELCEGRRVVEGFTLDTNREGVLEDGLSIEKTEDGYILTVSIIDLPSAITEGGSIESEAISRFETTYIRKGKNIRMMPRHVGAKYNLRSDSELKPAVSFRITFNDKGQQRNVEIFKSAFKSTAHLSFAFSDQLVESTEQNPEHAELAEQLSTLYRIGAKVRNRRLGFRKGTPVNADMVVGEFMGLVSVEAARYLTSSSVRALYRVVDENQRGTFVPYPRESDLEIRVPVTSPVRNAANYFGLRSVNALLDGSTVPFQYDPDELCTYMNARLARINEVPLEDQIKAIIKNSKTPFKMYGIDLKRREDVKGNGETTTYLSAIIVVETENGEILYETDLVEGDNRREVRNKVMSAMLERMKNYKNPLQKENAISELNTLVNRGQVHEVRYEMTEQILVAGIRCFRCVLVLTIGKQVHKFSSLAKSKKAAKRLAARSCINEPKMPFNQTKQQLD